VTRHRLRSQRARPGSRTPRASRSWCSRTRSYGEVIDSGDAAFLTRLARRYALATRYYALTHPSLPNYIALTTGGTGGITNDCSNCDTERPSFANQLTDAGVSWRAYFESLPADAAAPVSPYRSYDKHYDPFVYTRTVFDSGQLSTRLTNFGRLREDIARRTLPRLSWIAPNVEHDGHNSSVRDVDRSAARLVPALLRALGPRGLLYITWDEGDPNDTAGRAGSSGGGRIPLIAAGAFARRHAELDVEADHYSLLRTLEANFGLDALGAAGAPSTPLLRGLLRHSRRAHLPARASGAMSSPLKARHHEFDSRRRERRSPRA
jgi:hypothetical protein